MDSATFFQIVVAVILANILCAVVPVLFSAHQKARGNSEKDRT